MAESQLDKKLKSPNAEREERILQSWKENDIFNKTLLKIAPKGEFVFFEGPPTANGRPGIHHLEARAFKDAIPRYKTMRGFYVRRKGGWDTHGLPVELQVEKELGLKSKKEIDSYGIATFNEKCKESVWKYVHEWEDFTNRMGYWVDLKNPYITYKAEYIESVWNVIKIANDKKLLYKDYKVVPWCPRCGTGLSSHELAQGYEEVKDLTLYVKFKVKNEENTFLLAWTTTPWTLPGNVALAVGKDIEYVEVKVGDDFLILAKERLSILKDTAYEIIETKKGSEMAGLSYEPLFSFLKDNVTGSEKEKLENAFKVYAGDFVTTTDGTGIVHIAPMYGQDDFELGTKNNLPKYHLVSDDGTFKKECGFLAGRFVKEKNEAGKPTLDVDIVEYLKKNNTFFAQESYKHTYPHCWRCHTPLIYFARDSWYIRMSSLRDELVAQNEGIHWEPEHIKEGRFGEWLREIKDWAISRERYWGTPLPIWSCEKCQARRVVASVEELKKPANNTYFVMRHGQADNNVQNVMSSRADNPHQLTELGKQQVLEGSRAFKKMLGDKKVDYVFVSPFLRTQQTSQIVARELGIVQEQVITEIRLSEWNTGVWNNKSIIEFKKYFDHGLIRFNKAPDGGESYVDITRRVGSFLYELEAKYKGKNILLITHESPSFLLLVVAKGADIDESAQMDVDGGGDSIKNGQVVKVNFSSIPHNAQYELDLHRPFIDEITFTCSCGGTMKRVKEVMDVWFDSGAMPFAQDHKFASKKEVPLYPADFISEAIDQTRGWFYTLHAIGVLMGKGKAYKNVICLGHILDAEGKKMSKSVGNVVSPWDMMDLYGADALRFWMYSVNQPGDSKNFDQKTVDEVVKKVFNLASNVLSFYKMYEKDKTQVSGLRNSKSANLKTKVKSQNVLDQWIMTRMDEVISTVTNGLDGYVFLEPTRTIRDFIADLSQWYLRRSRDRFKGDDEVDKQDALATTKYILITLAKVMAPFTPFFAEFMYAEAGGVKESVHLEEWPEAKKVDQDILTGMKYVQSLASMIHMERSKNKIPVRQPLRMLSIKHFVKPIPHWDKFEIVLKAEINVEQIILESNMTQDDPMFKLDTTIYPDLKEKGDVRELIRSIQELRKEKGLSVGDKVLITVPELNRLLVEKYGAEIKKVTGLLEIKVADSLGIVV